SREVDQSPIEFANLLRGEAQFDRDLFDRSRLRWTFAGPPMRKKAPLDVEEVALVGRQTSLEELPSRYLRVMEYRRDLIERRVGLPRLATLTPGTDGVGTPHRGPHDTPVRCRTLDAEEDRALGAAERPQRVAAGLASPARSPDGVLDERGPAVIW